MTIRRLTIDGSPVTVRALVFPRGRYHVSNKDWEAATDGLTGELLLRAPDRSILAHAHIEGDVGVMCVPVWGAP